MTQVAKRVLIAGLFGDLGVAPLDAIRAALGVIIASGLRSVPVKNVVVDTGERYVDAINPLSAPVPRVAHQCAVDGDFVGLQVFHNFFPGGLATVLLAIGDDEDDAPAVLGARGKFLGSSEDCVVQGMNLFGRLYCPMVCVDPPGCSVGEGQFPLIEIAHAEKGSPPVTGTMGSVPADCAIESTAGRRPPCAAVKPVHSLGPLV